ncbi:restriction endonuclease subunit S [Flavonifractor plautii]|uniref:restriction endonuclease subunit S n=1 Tax=Flavonifractor plautii TaxID=292800 RepID=UPI0022E5AF88|nr:restriction endonuclease subunit S [Flavonifractor plautii]
MIGFGHIAEPDFYTHFPAMLPRSSRPRAAWGTGVYPSKQYFDIKMRCLRQRRHRRRWYLKGADNTPYEKIGDEVRSLADEVPFEIPDSWEWVRLIDVCEYIQRGKSPKYSPIKKYPVVAQKCNQWSGFSIEKAQFIEPNSLSSYGPERLLQDNDLMWNSTGLGTLGRMAIYKTAANPYKLAVADSHVTVIRPLKQFVLPEYLYYYFANPSVQSVIEDQADGTTKQKELATATIKAYLTPIPPLDEQRRILAKLSEVLPVVKNYGVVYDETTAMQEAFPESLKKSILQEAVQGKLVPQDPSDEPAEALLERIRAEKQRLIKEGKIKKDKHESVIFRRDNSHYEKLDGVERCIDDELLFEIPDSWEWVRLGTVLEIARGGSPRPIQQYLTTEPDGINWIKIGDTDKGGKYIYKTKEKIRPEGVAKSRMVHSGDFLLTNSMSFGRPYILKSDGCIHDGWLVLSNRFECYSVDFLYYILSSPFAYYQFCDSVSGAVVKNLNSDKVANALFPLPPLSEQKRIVQRIEELLPLVKGL